MTKRVKMLIPAVTLVLGIAVLNACGSSAYAKLDDPLMPGAKTAIVNFIGSNSACGVVWDEDTPIGDFYESGYSNIVWETTPGSHYFIIDGFNYIVLRADLEANKRYYVNIMTIPNPIPFASAILATRTVSPDEGENWIKRVKMVSFTDKWRSDFVQNKKDKIKDTQKRLQEAKASSMNVNIKKTDGR